MFLGNGEFYFISPYETRATFFSTRTLYDNSFITHHPSLEEKFLRRLFTGIEYLVFKIYHLVVKELDFRYTFEQGRTKARLNAIRDLIGFDSNYIRTFDAIFRARDAFAHSFIDVNEIKYHGIELNICFGHTHSGRMNEQELPNGSPIFMDDVIEIVMPLDKYFKTIQFEQIEKNKFLSIIQKQMTGHTLEP